MPFSLGPLVLADVWQPFLHSALLALEFPAVPDIDCDNCRMERMGFFSGATKCCTYTPEFPNFLVGQMLHDGAAPPQVHAWIAQRRGDPLFLNAPPRQKRAHFEAARVPSQALPCPLLHAGRCTAYAYRPYLCAGYHCAYPNTPSYRAFWNALVSLLALHTAIAAQHVMEALGHNRGAYIDTWNSMPREEDAWVGDGLREAFYQELWQQADARAFYVDAYLYVRDHASSLRQDLDKFRRAQLKRVLAVRNVLSETRAQEIDTQSDIPSETILPTVARAAFERGVVVFADHIWTVPEHESYVLTLHKETIKGS